MAPEGLPADAPAPPPDRSRRVYAWWTAALTFLAALGVVCWLVVGPVLKVKHAIEACSTPSSCIISGEGEPLVTQLGGQERASQKLRLYLQASALFGNALGDAGSRESAAVLLGRCGKWGLAKAVPMLRSRDPRVRQDGALAMCAFFRRPSWWDIPLSGPEREKALAALDPETRRAAVDALSVLETVLGEVKRPNR
jgi:hypothetical protein